ncbi:hypothetical protein LCGC14_2710040 [marine sediment metagenome]|uniref:Uncharacterized protein n=1 Tax=marine sediment metagenome TaxID=412755 RepID=A0A0F9A0X2_9ZZZZ
MLSLGLNPDKALRTAQSIANSIHETVFIIVSEFGYRLARRSEKYQLVNSYNEPMEVEPITYNPKV